MDSNTKIALLLGLTILGLLGGINYMKSTERSLMRISPNLGVKNLHDREHLFQAWVEKYDKNYNIDEHQYRFKIWSQSYDFVQEHNAQGLSWEVELNAFADLTNEEFITLKGGYIYDPDRVRENVKYLDESEAPQGTTWDWRQKGAVAPVKDQGSCGSCFTYSSAAALEGVYFIGKGSLVEFSNQQLLDCTSSYGNQGCSGGLMVPCFKYTKDKGIQKYADYPYKGKVATCAYNASKIVFKNTGYFEVPKNDFTQLRVAVKKNPTSVAVMAGSDGFKLYKTGIISANCGTDLDHAITAVGYGSGFWIVKNSWGASWGEEGYVRIASGSQNDGAGMCGINMEPSYPTL